MVFALKLLIFLRTSSFGSQVEQAFLLVITHSKAGFQNACMYRFWFDFIMLVTVVSTIFLGRLYFFTKKQRNNFDFSQGDEIYERSADFEMKSMKIICRTKNKSRVIRMCGGAKGLCTNGDSVS